MGIFKGKISVDDIVKDATSAIDKAFFTNEEKADYYKNMADSVAEHAKDSLSENTIRSKSRRNVSNMFVFVYLSLIIIYAIGAFIKITPETAYDPGKIWSLITNDTLNTAMIMILSFYYGGYYAQSLIVKIQDRIKTKKENK